MEQKILCISGRKQAGKDTCYKFLRNLLTRNETFPAMSDVIRQFYFAEPLKRMCVDILGCPRDRVYGTDEDKNTLVPHLLWENFPVPVLTDGTIVKIENKQYRGWDEDDVERSIFAKPCMLNDDQYLRSGPMSVREVLQYWGTEVFRRQYQNVWADACIRAIRESKVPFAVITDCRFVNEVVASQQAGGKVIRLDRVVFPEDNHVSETSLDPDKFDWNRFDYIMKNSNMTVVDQCFALYDLLNIIWKWLPEIPGETVENCARRAA